MSDSDENEFTTDELNDGKLNEDVDMEDFVEESIETDTASTFTQSGDYRGNFHADLGEYVDGDESASDVDPRGLYQPVGVDMIRWHFRNNPLANVVVTKPVRDAFKNGFKHRNDANNIVKNQINRHEFIRKLILGRIKARRDGMALLLLNVKEDSDAALHNPPKNPTDVTGVTVRTLDDLYTRRSTAEGTIPEELVADKVGKSAIDIRVNKDGEIINEDEADTHGYGEVMGYVLDFDDDSVTNPNDPNVDPKVIHPSRVRRMTHSPEVDGDLTKQIRHRQGDFDSVLQPSIGIMNGLMKGNWAITHSLYRYAGQLYVARGDMSNDDVYKAMQNQMRNINAKSSLLLPSEEMEVTSISSDGELDPEPYFDVLFDQICASTEMTRSVLFGTQSGTVSGSETDIKNYYNQVNRMRQRKLEQDIYWYADKLRAYGNFGVNTDYHIEWNPLFELPEEDQATIIQQTMQAAANGVQSGILSQSEARRIFKKRMDEHNITVTTDDVTLAEEMNEAEMERLERLGMITAGEQVPESEENEEGGMPAGESTASAQPDRDDEDDGLGNNYYPE